LRQGPALVNLLGAVVNQSSQTDATALSVSRIVIKGAAFRLSHIVNALTSSGYGLFWRGYARTALLSRRKSRAHSGANPSVDRQGLGRISRLDRLRLNLYWLFLSWLLNLKLNRLNINRLLRWKAGRANRRLDFGQRLLSGRNVRLITLRCFKLGSSCVNGSFNGVTPTNGGVRIRNADGARGLSSLLRVSHYFCLSQLKGRRLPCVFAGVATA